MKVLPLLLAAQYGYQHTVIAQAILNYRCNGQWNATPCIAHQHHWVPVGHQQVYEVTDSVVWTNTL